MPIVRFLEPALEDIVEISARIGATSPAAAYRFLRAVDQAALRLSGMPGMGHHLHLKRELLQDIRSWPLPGFPRYLAFYRPIANGIEVIRVLHGARDIPAVLGREEE